MGPESEPTKKQMVVVPLGADQHRTLACAQHRPPQAASTPAPTMAASNIPSSIRRVARPPGRSARHSRGRGPHPGGRRGPAPRDKHVLVEGWAGAAATSVTVIITFFIHGPSFMLCSRLYLLVSTQSDFSIIMAGIPP